MENLKLGIILHVGFLCLLIFLFKLEIIKHIFKAACQSCNQSFAFSVVFPSSGSYALNATGQDSMGYYSNFVYNINVTGMFESF